MLDAREEDVVSPAAAEVVIDENNDAGDDDAPGGKRARAGNEDEPLAKKGPGKNISKSRLKALELLLGKTFARMQGITSLARQDLFASINEELATGEDAF